jgi:hypothetical protein
LSPKFADSLISSNQNTSINFTTLYYSDYLLKYQKYIERGGLLEATKEEEGYYVNEVTAFKKEHFTQFFKNSWKNHLVLSK